ncbi:hypothetical protein D1872_192120 [compost metagenome]|uniref:hypothetical protein n=1 Tax=Aneurinibacillus migulanus TaxID=47500 RepID=UPI000F92CB3A|nr:hypothetical protein [Aneurinibacillus migulanus]
MKKKVIGGLMVATMAFSSAGVVSAANIGHLNGIDLSNMDIETALMLVQSQRQQLLDSQLQNQMKEVQQRNNQITELNRQLGDLKRELDNTRDEKQKEALQKQIESLKGQIDSLGSAAQMDMLRLQSLSNKRNEAFDVMTDFVKKMQDSRNSIISNMR